MACKKPVMMVIDGVSRKLVEDAQCGVYIEPENPADFKTKIEAYQKKSIQDLAKEGEAGYQYAKKHFDRDVLAKKYLNYLKSIVKP